MNNPREILSSSWMLSNVVSLLGVLLICLVVLGARIAACRYQQHAKYGGGLRKHTLKDTDVETSKNVVMITRKPSEISKEETEKNALMQKARLHLEKLRQEIRFCSRRNRVRQTTIGKSIPDLIPVCCRGTLSKYDKTNCEFYKCRNRNFCNEMKRCAGCAKIVYCSVACQTKDWSRHSRECPASKDCMQLIDSAL